MELAKASGKTVAEVARDLSVNDTTLGNWFEADRAERGGLARTSRGHVVVQTDCVGAVLTSASERSTWATSSIRCRTSVAEGASSKAW